MTDKQRCGLVALVGAPNVGKSTLLNALVGEKVGIISPKPNTTRVTVRGVTQLAGSQFVFVDTPGLNRSEKTMDRALVQQARAGLMDADVVALVIDAVRGFDPQAEEVCGLLKESGQTAVLVINKIDKLEPRSKVLARMQAAQEKGIFAEVFAVSATKGGARGSGVKDILPVLAGYLPEGPWLFPPEMVTDMPLPLRLAEVTREKAMRMLHQEIPYGIAVITDLIEDGEPVQVVQTLLVGREGHKGMVLGKGGQMLKRIGTMSRQDMQKVLQTGVRLDLQVKVSENWAERQELLKETGILT